jgi:hypothetical protein
MAGIETSTIKLRPVHELVPDEQAREMLKVSEAGVAGARIRELAALIWHHENATKAEINVGIARAIEHFNSLAPGDGAEAMLAEQMVATHFAALECLRRAAIPNQYAAARKEELKQASKLMALYARQLDTLNKHRGKGQQKVTVEHVHVAEGGQAIVGQVNASAGAKDAVTVPQIARTTSGTVAIDLPKKKKARRSR